MAEEKARTTLFIQKQFNLFCEYFAKYHRIWFRWIFAKWKIWWNIYRYREHTFTNYSEHHKQLIYRKCGNEFPWRCCINYSSKNLEQTISSLDKYTKYWSENIVHIVFRLASFGECWECSYIFFDILSRKPKGETTGPNRVLLNYPRLPKNYPNPSSFPLAKTCVWNHFFFV